MPNPAPKRSNARTAKASTSKPRTKARARSASADSTRASGARASNGATSSANGTPRPQPPPWRSVVNRVDRLVTPPTDAFVRTNLFADVISAMTRLEVQVRRRMENQTAWAWHLVNLPTAGDVRRVRAQLATLEARIRDMSERMDEREGG